MARIIILLFIVLNLQSLANAQNLKMHIDLPNNEVGILDLFHLDITMINPSNMERKVDPILCNTIVKIKEPISGRWARLPSLTDILKSRGDLVSEKIKDTLKYTLTMRSIYSALKTLSLDQEKYSLSVSYSTLFETNGNIDTFHYEQAVTIIAIKEKEEDVSAFKYLIGSKFPACFSSGYISSALVSPSKKSVLDNCHKILESFEQSKYSKWASLYLLTQRVMSKGDLNSIKEKIQALIKHNSINDVIFIEHANHLLAHIDYLMQIN